MSLRASDWIDVCAVDDVPAPGARRVRIGTATVALLRPDGERVFALEDRCPHKGGPLSEGIVSHDRVACPLHGRCVELATGRLIAPDEGETRTFSVRIEAGRVFLQRDVLRSLTGVVHSLPCEAGEGKKHCHPEPQARDLDARRTEIPRIRSE